jgi:hypothetical protein
MNAVQISQLIFGGPNCEVEYQLKVLGIAPNGGSVCLEDIPLRIDD